MGRLSSSSNDIKLPVVFEFERNPAEHVNVAFSVGAKLAKGANSKRAFVFAFLASALLSAGVIVLMQFADRYAFSLATPLTFLLGAGSAVAALLIYGQIYQRLLKRKYALRVKHFQSASVRLDYSGITSVVGGLRLETEWADVDDIYIDGDLLIVTSELFGHSIPQRSLPLGGELEQLRDLITASKKNAMEATH